MATRYVIVTLRNNSNQPYYVAVGCTVVLNDIGGSGCDLNASGNPYTDLPIQLVWVYPNQQTTVTFTFDDSQIGGVSTYPGEPIYAIVKVWMNYSNGVPSNCVAGAYGLGFVE